MVGYTAYPAVVMSKFSIIIDVGKRILQNHGKISRRQPEIPGNYRHLPASKSDRESDPPATSQLNGPTSEQRLLLFPKL